MQPLRLREIVWDCEPQDLIDRFASAGNNIGLSMPVVIYHPGGLCLGNIISIGEFTHI